MRRARTDRLEKPLNKRTLNDLFHQPERISGVEPVEGRGWYGIRRKATDTCVRAT